IDGRIEALGKPDEWLKDRMECLLCFENVTGLLVNGSGLIHGHGEAWWDSVSHSHRPRTVRFNGVINMVYNGLTQKNSPKNHISVHNCTNATLSNLHLIAPGDSPNTDGIDVSLSNGLQILNSSIETGDDCIAINSGSRNISIARVACGPGHGISIGSLGRDGANETVENVKVWNCSFNGTQNGARIKTWAGGLGFARNILFENITLIDADNPIVIDQHYCNGGHDCDHDKKTAVGVSNVTFRYFEGTCTGETAIKLDCDKKTRCRKIVMDHINITSSPSSSERNLNSYCRFADVVSRFVSVDLSCLDSEDCLPPAPY
ncbi:PREDICTED: probable polygalacturonase At3g15720, partial [Tarenaya hassleriana]|uniref:probable polygalacturonase At3g15720 n=1 Tax=Tarenaya hassleriana TaxID=28532 RepID=UPI0008FD1A3C